MQIEHSSDISNDFFSLLIQPYDQKTIINMQVLSPIVNTFFLPNTWDILQQRLPAIHTSLCFNDKNLPFSKEVRKTEIGHLFEHILLEYIYELKTSQGLRNVSVKGETSWDWYKNPTGFFTIHLNIGLDEQDIFFLALRPAVSLLQYIFVSHTENRLGVKSISHSGENFTPALPVPET